MCALRPFTDVYLITGRSASGKSTLGAKLSQLLNVPLYSKDEIILRLFKTFERTPETLPKIRRLTHDELFQRMRDIRDTRKPIMIDADFDDHVHSETILNLSRGYYLRLSQVHCTCSPELCYERYQARDARGERDPLHTKVKDYEEYCKWFVDDWTPLLLLPGSTLITVDTTDFATVSADAIAKKLDRQPVAI